MSHRTTIVQGKTNHLDKDLMAIIGDLLDGNAAVVGVNDYQVTQNGPVAMNVLVLSGTIFTYISSAGTYYRHSLTDATTQLTIDPNSSGSTRIDLICHKTDLTITPDADGGGIASLVVVKGTAGAGVPATPANHTKLAEVTIVNGAASISTSNITDRRNLLTFKKVRQTLIQKITEETDGATITIDLSSSNIRSVILGGNRTLVLSNVSIGQIFALDLLQDATGSRIPTWFSGSSTFATTDVVTATDIITVGRDIPTLTPIKFTTTGGLPAGLSAGVTYYAVRQSATTIKVASSVANAQAGTTIDITTQGTGTHTIETHIRWPGRVAPTVSTGKYAKDSFGFKCINTGIFDGYILGQDL
jgi:hypothetical protein